MHHMRIYPRRILMNVAVKQSPFKLNIKFEGCSRDGQLNQELLFPLGVFIAHDINIKFYILFCLLDSLPPTSFNSSPGDMHSPQSKNIVCEYDNDK